MGPCSRSVLISFTVCVTKQHPVNISFQKNKCSALKRHTRSCRLKQYIQTRIFNEALWKDYSHKQVTHLQTSSPRQTRVRAHTYKHRLTISRDMDLYNKLFIHQSAQCYFYTCKRNVFHRSVFIRFSDIKTINFIFNSNNIMFHPLNNYMDISI